MVKINVYNTIVIENKKNRKYENKEIFYINDLCSPRYIE